MSIVIIRQDDKIESWKQAIHRVAPDIPVYSYLETHPRDAIEVALLWKHPIGSLEPYKNLKYIASSGAGVDFIFEDEQRPKELPITRVIDNLLAADMSEHVIALIFNYLKNLDSYRQDQNGKRWQPTSYQRIGDVKIGILGLGALGKNLAETLVKFGFQTQGWSNSTKYIDNVNSFAGASELPNFLSSSNILVCLLPLTSLTRGILNQSLFAQLPQDAYLINVARGGHLVDADLIAFLDNGHLSGASLDVFHEEPLASTHPFWEHKKILMTPHCASVSDTDSVVPQVIENYRRMKKDEALRHVVAPDKGY